MSRSLYAESGYLDFDYIESKSSAFNMIIGGRGIGKTYGCLLYHLGKGQPFLFLRRTQTQTDIISNPIFNPVVKVASDMGMELFIKPIPKTKSTACYDSSGNLICVHAALSTFANMRGWSGDEIKSIIYDEFIPSPGERPIKDEGHSFLHCYETIVRNRELSGSEPVPVYLLANAFDTTADLLRVLNLSETVERMHRKGIHERTVLRGNTSIYIALPESPISERKKSTTLYEIADDQFKKLSIENSDSKITDIIRYRPLREYRLHVTTSDFAVYRHKSDGSYYVCKLTVKAQRHFYDNDRERQKFKLTYKNLMLKYLSGNIYFDSRLHERQFVEWLTKT